MSIYRGNFCSSCALVVTVKAGYGSHSLPNGNQMCTADLRLVEEMVVIGLISIAQILTVIKGFYTVTIGTHVMCAKDNLNSVKSRNVEELESNLIDQCFRLCDYQTFDILSQIVITFVNGATQGYTITTSKWPLFLGIKKVVLKEEKEFS